MPAKKKAGGKGLIRRKLAGPRLARFLKAGSYSLPPVLVEVREGKPESFYDVHVVRELQDIEWWTPDGTDLSITFDWPPAAKKMKAVRLKGKHSKLPANEHKKVQTPPNAKGVVVKYTIHVTFKSGKKDIDPYIIIQP
ncbi:MAG: hypothetical protein NDJ92_16320 [Thermoanaerobaculia bacterium]|nr:hypothetical protein [Thermoanaerobaculia bacterium]